MAGVLYLRDPETGEFVPVPTLVGPPGPGVPAGGTAGQVLVKSGEADYAAEWRENDASKLGGKGPEYYASDTSKVNQAGWTPNKYLGTNASGEVVEKNTPDSPTHKSFIVADLTTLTVEGAIRRAEQEMDFTNTL